MTLSSCRKHTVNGYLIAKEEEGGGDSSGNYYIRF